jgi:hypothetical protein
MILADSTSRTTHASGLDEEQSAAACMPRIEGVCRDAVAGQVIA